MRFDVLEDRFGGFANRNDSLDDLVLFPGFLSDIFSNFRCPIPRLSHTVLVGFEDGALTGLGVERRDDIEYRDPAIEHGYCMLECFSGQWRTIEWDQDV